MLLSFIRTVRFDMLNMTHFCCHRGKGLGQTWNFDPHPDFIDIGKILKEEQSMIEALEAEMQRHTSESLDTLKFIWMGMMKKVYDGVSGGSQAQMKETNSFPSQYLDYKKDTFNLSVVIDPDDIFRYDLAQKLSEYAFWLQHEYSRTLDHPQGSLFKEGWHAKRMSWLTKLVNTMGISVQKIKQVMEGIHLEETSSEKIDAKAIVDQFWTSLRASSWNYA
ncbi:hypothetical protein PMG11_03087 [Penicillium brasilianum]|uniref:Uncharacterized protein n=1 Tax=Penicillium brasilianum TaxID=104259 RepID=A0A0F7VGK1_PENBI|nr:hypothetical protein PMG11_03087 [Penicillium brasilianum]